MTGPYEVYIRDAHGVLHQLTGRYAAEVMASFWEDKRIERNRMPAAEQRTGQPYVKIFTDSDIAALQGALQNPLTWMGGVSTVTLDNGRVYRIEEVHPEISDEDED